MNDEEAILRTIAEYAQLAGDARLDDLVDLWTDDGVFTDAGTRHVGADAIRKYLAGSLRQESTESSKYLAVNHVVDVGDTDASAAWDLVVLARNPDGVFIDRVGRYSDRFVRKADRWKIAEQTGDWAAWHPPDNTSG